jgi:hypothetical protein
MSPSVWGPPIWNFLHTLAAKIKDDKYNEVSRELFFYIQKICANLPCPECSQHARTFLGKIIFSRVSTKNDLIKLLYLFHNSVNRRKVKPVFAFEEIGKYSQNSLIHAYNNFIVAYHTKGNMKLLADSFQRKLIIQEFRKWMLRNLSNFDR